MNNEAGKLVVRFTGQAGSTSFNTIRLEDLVGENIS